MNPPDLTQLLRASLAGDSTSFGGIVRRYQQPLFGFLGRMGLPQALAEDIAQEAFLRAWRNLANFDTNRAQFSTWLFAIARNLALNELASAKHAFEMTTSEVRRSSVHYAHYLTPIEAPWHWPMSTNSI
jgi:RNA polymerase sigma-70 factor, ECF subfamily